jgi:hypothetical protein
VTPYREDSRVDVPEERVWADGHLGRQGVTDVTARVAVREQRIQFETLRHAVICPIVLQFGSQRPAGSASCCSAGFRGGSTSGRGGGGGGGGKPQRVDCRDVGEVDLLHTIGSGHIAEVRISHIGSFAKQRLFHQPGTRLVQNMAARECAQKPQTELSYKPISCSDSSERMLPL